jgi:hypothetical protein
MLTAIVRSSAYVMAHLVVISESGIDPRTTPVWRNYRMFRGLRWGILGYSVSIAAILMCEKMGIACYWVSNMLRDLANVVVMSAGAYLFRLKSETTNGYMMIVEDAPPRRIERKVILDLSPEDLEFGRRRWSEDMALPPQPVFADEIGDDELVRV